MTAIFSDSVLVLDRLSARVGESACEAVSLSIQSGSIHALIGHSGAGKAAAIACVLGKQKPSAGRVLTVGRDVWANRRSISTWVRLVTLETRIQGSATVNRLARRESRQAASFDEKLLHERLARLGVPKDQPWELLSRPKRWAALLALALAGPAHLIILQDIGVGVESIGPPALRDELRVATSRGASVLIATQRPEDIEDIADGASILRCGKLVLTGVSDELRRRFRRIRYRNEITSERTEYGNELDGFDAVRVRVRGWGVEAVVSNFRDSAYDEFQRIPGVVDAQAFSMSLAEIFETVG